MNLKFNIIIKKMKNTIVIYLLFFVSWVSCEIFPSVPPHLLPCYRGGARDVWAPRRLDVLLGLLRRLENNSQLNLRTFSATVLRSFRLDGIEQAENGIETEFVTPYRATGFQFHKYKILMDKFLPGQGPLDIDVLTVHEQCALHKMLSSTVARWERGDENRVCPISVEQGRINHVNNFVNASRSFSRCPIEEGVILTDWGTITPGTVVAAIAAALESQNIAMSEILSGPAFRSSIAEPLGDDTEIHLEIETLANTLQAQPETNTAFMNNLYVATLSGDLAEVAVNQGPQVGASPQRMTVGSSNRWNDTLLPRDYYLLVQDQNVINWHYTDAELLAGIDGFIIGKYIPNWISQRATLSLSQVLYMYYSNEGVSFNPEARACNRTELFNEIFKNETERLYSELSSFARLLSISQGNVIVLGDQWNKINRAAVDAFISYIPSVLEKYQVPCDAADVAPSVNVVLATDGAWTGYDVEQFSSWLGGIISLGWRSTSLALVHGNSGDWLAPPARNITALFHTLRNTTIEWPNRLNFPNVLSTVIQYLQNLTLSEVANEVSVATSTIVLIISPGDRPTDAEIERARTQMNSLTQTYLDVYFAYVGRDLSAYKTINQYNSPSEYFLQVDTTTVQEAVRTIRANIIKSPIPKRIIGPQCPVNGTSRMQKPYEDFLLPYRTNTYRINPFYLKEQPVIGVQFRGTATGMIMVCQRRGEDAANALSCHEVAPHTYYWFNITTPCPSADLCPPVYFTVKGISTQHMCANNDCLTPHEVSYYIEHTGFRCLPLQGDANLNGPLLNNVILLLFINYLYFKVN